MNRVLAAWRQTWQADKDAWLLGVAALMLAACLFKPSLPMERQLFSHLLVLDVTQSMNVQDHVLEGKPASRLAFAKHAARDALLQLPCGSKLGLGIFTEYRTYLLLAPVEVCANLQELRSTLARLDGRMAWTGNSEVSKGLFSGLAIASQLDSKPSLVFVTDGHEAPPLAPERRPAFGGTLGEVPGLIVGVGGVTPLPIPKTDTLGRPLGFWAADEVLQTPPHAKAGEAADGKGSTGGSEHLSSLHEAHLKWLASTTGLKFLRLQDSQAFSQTLLSPGLARPIPARWDLRPLLAGLGLVLLLARHLRWPLLRHRL